MLVGDVRAAQNLLHLRGEVQRVGVAAVEERLEAAVITEGPDPGAVGNDAGVRPAQAGRRFRALSPERCEHDVRRPRLLRRHSEPVAELAGVVQRSGKCDGQRAVAREARLVAALQLADAERAGADHLYHGPLAAVRGGGEHAPDRVGCRLAGTGEDRR